MRSEFWYRATTEYELYPEDYGRNLEEFLKEEAKRNEEAEDEDER